MEGTRYSSRPSEQGSRISQLRSEYGRCGWGCFWNRNVECRGLPFLSWSLLLLQFSDCVRLIPGSAHRDVIRPSVAVACSIYHRRMWNQESLIVSNCQHIGTPEGRLVGKVCEKSALVYRLQPLSYAAQGQSASHIQLQHRPTPSFTSRSFRKQSITLCCPLKEAPNSFAPSEHFHQSHSPQGHFELALRRDLPVAIVSTLNFSASS